MFEGVKAEDHKLDFVTGELLQVKMLRNSHLWFTNRTYKIVSKMSSSYTQ